jgi:hypothetical protein
MRGREFLMKDAYSFDLDAEGARKSYNRMFVAYLNLFSRMGLKAVPMRADTGPIGGDLSHEFIVLAETGESAVFCHKDLVEMAAPGPDVDWYGDLQPLVDQRTALYAATEEMHDEAAFAASARGRPPVGARHRGGPHLLVRDQVFRADEGPGHRAGRQGRAGADGQLRRRRLAPAGRDHRGQPRRRRHHLAGVGRAVRRRHHQHAPGRRRLRRGLRDRLRGAEGRRPRPAL